MFSPPSFFSVTTPPETPTDAFPRRSHPHASKPPTTATTSESASATSVSLQIPLTPSATEPITPTTGKPLFPDFHNSLKELLEPASSMSPTEPRGLLHHPAPFNLGGELHTGGVSQERSTASNGNTQSSTLPPLGSWPKEDLFDLPLLSRPHSNMLPPLRTHEPTHANPAGTGIQYLYSTNPHTVHTYANNHYHSPCPPVYKHNHGYSNPATHSYPVYYIAHPQPSYASSPDPTGHMSNGQIYPPHQAPTPAYPYGTIPPATFQSWQGNNDERGRGSTISGSLLSGAAAHHEERLMDRRASSQSVGDRADDHGDDHDHDHDQDEEHEEVGKKAKAPVSPATSAGSGSGKSDDDVIYAQEMPPSPPVQDGEMFYTTDAEVKQTRELKRMCYNCQAKKPPSWRKSLLHLGKILCNKCGIFERTHNRSRPRQNEDLKLRRPPAPYNRGNRAPPPAQLDLRADAMSSIGSPYSTVASMTPLSAGFGFPYGSSSTGHTGAVSAPPPLSEDQDSHRSVHFQHGHSSSSLSTSTVQDRRRQSDMDGYPTSSLGHNVMTSQDQYHPGHPNQFTGLGRAVSATSTRERGSDSPYAQAYNARRTASYSTSSRAKAKGGVLSAPMSAGLQPALSLWNHSQRRHSEANIHQVLDDSPE